MHWAVSIAKRLIQSRPDKKEYVCAAGISPSGSVHIGNFRDLATSYFVVLALKKAGKQARLLFSWDDFDRFRKVPAGVPETFSEHIGKPYTAVPDPFSEYDSYAARFQKEFEQAMQMLGIDIDYRYQTREYRSGRYAEDIITAVRKRGLIYDILAAYRTQPPSAEEREAFYPVTVYCPETGKDDTTILSAGDDCATLTYRSAGGTTETLDIRTADNVKLSWKVDWPMRWKAEGVDFEPGGADHASAGGSYTVSKRISREVFDYPAPVFQGYEFVGIKGGAAKMSGSSGNTITPGRLLRVYEPEIIRWIFARHAPKKAFNISLDEDVLKTYDEFDRAYRKYASQSPSNDPLYRTMELSLFKEKPPSTVPFRQLAGFANIAGDNLPALEGIFERLGTPYRAPEFISRLKRSQYWLATYAPEKIITLGEAPNQAYFDTLNDEEKSWVHALHDQLAKVDGTFAELEAALYAIPKKPDLSDTEKKERQRRFFTIIYNLLIQKDTGPRLSTFLKALPAGEVAPLLDFHKNR